MAKILVTGASGTIGRQVVVALRKRGADVRAGVHSPSKADGLRRLGAEVVELDFAKPETVSHATAGVDRAFLLSPFVEEFASQVKLAVEAARQAGVRFILRMSAAGADPEAKLSLSRQHGQADTDVQRSGLAWTVIQPNFFQDNVLNFSAHTIKSQSAFYGASGTGRTAYISSADIAECAATILLAPEAHHGKTYVLTGPAAHSDEAVAALASQVAGRVVKYVDLPPDQYAQGARSSGTPEWMVEALVGLEAVKANGWAAAVSPSVQQILCRPGETFLSFLERNKARLT